MPTTDPLARFGTKKTPQNQPVPGRSEQVKNNAGGYVFEVDWITRLRRFLVMGTAGGTYYVGQDALTRESGEFLLLLTNTAEFQKRAVDVLVEISVAGRAPKPNPALFALAIFCQEGTTEAKQYARKQITKVVRTGTHLFQFVGYLEQFGGWGRGLRKAVASWYIEKDADQLAYQLVKYRQREGWTHRDVLRKCHAEIKGSPELQEYRKLVEAGIVPMNKEREAERLDLIRKRALINWAVKNTLMGSGPVPSLVTGFVRAQRGNVAPHTLVENYKLPWEALPDSAMNDTKVWDKLLDNGMPITALVRQLPRLTQLGMLPPMGRGRTSDVIAQLLNPEAVAKSRIHPIQVLTALYTYRSGSGKRSQWTPSIKIIDALDEMFYMSFKNVEATGKRTVIALDVSGSMRTHQAGNTPFNAAEISAAMAMMTVRTEPNLMVIGFTDGTPGNGTYRLNEPSMVTDLPISSRQRLDDVIRTVTTLKAKATDCSLPMMDAISRELEVDTFVIYTDNETFYGAIHPYQALNLYRKESGINAKLIVVSATPSKFSIADPKDPGMLDISGFDSAVPQLISDFSAGKI